MVDARSVGAVEAQRYLVAAATVNPSWAQWKSDFWWKYRLALQAAVAEQPARPRARRGAVRPRVQIFGLFQTQGRRTSSTSTTRTS